MFCDRAGSRVRWFLRACSAAWVVLGLVLTLACAGGEPGLVSSSSQKEKVSGFAVGQIIETATGKPVSLDRLTALLRQQDVVYLGEEHHHQSHIENGLVILRSFVAQGRRPVLAMEMFSWDGQPALDRYVTGAEVNREEFLASAHWQTNWGGPFEDYEPLIQFAKEQSLTTDALNPPRALVRLVAKQGLAQAQADPIMAQWGMMGESIVDDPLYRTRILQQLQACHGGGADSLYATMYDASMVRDEGMAKTIVARLNRLRFNHEAKAGPVVSYTGGGHIQYNLPIPKRVARRFGEPLRQVTLYMASFDAGRIDELHQMIQERIADYLWLTPVSKQGPPRRC